MILDKVVLNEFNVLIDSVNNLDKQEDILKCLKLNVENVDLFLQIIKKINKTKLSSVNKQSTLGILNSKIELSKEELSKYTKEEAIALIKEHNGNTKELCKLSKKELDMIYYGIYGNKPLSSFNKEQVAQKLRSYVNSLSRANYLLNGIEL